MPQFLDAILRENPIALLFVILAAGYLVGKPKIRGFELGSVTGVLFAGLLFGHLGYSLPPVAQTFGFVMFIFSVGFQAGPEFFEVLRREGAKYFVLAITVAATGFALAATLSGWLEFPVGISAGLLAGAMTTTPTLAAAQDALQSGVVPMPSDMTVADAARNVATAYALTYLFGLVGLIVIIRVLPRIVGIDLADEAEKIAGPPARLDPGDQVSVRAYRVEKEGVVGPTYREIQEQLPQASVVEKLRRGGEMLEVDDDTTFEIGDEVAVVGRLSRFVEIPELVGPELNDAELLELETESSQIVVTRRDVVGTTLGELGIRDSTAGGLLTTGLIIGYLRSIYPTFGRIPTPASWVFMELGLQMFMAGVGVAAGSGIVDTLMSVGPSLVLSGIVVTFLPVLAGWLMGTFVLRINPAVLLGAITGAMTSGAALSVVNSAAKSTVPALGYTGAYAFANVILTIAGTLIVRL